VGDGPGRHGASDFFAEPAPAVTLRPPAMVARRQVLFEKYWLWQHP
jgi:hypothetical protein